MEFLANNWLTFLIIGGFFFFMSKGGGCCGGHSHGGSEHQGHKGLGDSGSKHIDKQIEMVIDPVCGMHVNAETAIKQKIDGKLYYFCSETCREDFVRKH